MKPRIVCVAFDKRNHDPLMKVYSAKPVKDKIDQLRAHIIRVCQDLSVRAPQALWLVLWPEYGISHGWNKGALNADEKKYYKDTLQKLAIRYPQLAIVAGTIQSYKTTTDPKKLDLIASYYDLHKTIEQEEEAEPAENQFFKAEKKKIAQLKKKNQAISYIRNSCFVFYGKDCWCHDKTAPATETTNNPHLTNTLFQPAKVTNKSPLCTLLHPITKTPINLGIEICHEHYHSVLKKADIANANLLHILLSDRIGSSPEKFSGKSIIHVDTVIAPKIIINDTNINVDVELYRTNFAKSDDMLHGPLAPTNPFINRLVTKVATIWSKIPSGDTRRDVFNTIFNNLEKLSKTFYDDAEKVYQCVEDMIETYKIYFTNKTFHSNGVTYRIGPDLLAFRTELLNLINEERKQHPKVLSIHDNRLCP